MAKRELWWCIKSPQYGLLPFTAHTLRIGSIGLFETHGMNPLQRARHLWNHQFKTAWWRSYREGYRCVRIAVRRSDDSNHG